MRVFLPQPDSKDFLVRASKKDYGDDVFTGNIGGYDVSLTVVGNYADLDMWERMAKSVWFAADERLADWPGLQYLAQHREIVLPERWETVSEERQIELAIGIGTFIILETLQNRIAVALEN
jgi:hypothetical protein